MNNFIKLLVPYYGADVRFRACQRLREFFRRHHLFFLATCLKSYLQYKYGCELSINAKISIKASFMHTVGVVIGEGCIIEDGVVIYSNVCLGRKDIENEDDYPIIKRNTILCTGSIVLGKVIVGESCTIAAGAVVLSDCDASSIYAGVPAKKIK